MLHRLLAFLCLIFALPAWSDSIYLDATTKSLELTTSSVAPVAYFVAYQDDYASKKLTKAAHGKVSSATTTTILSAPVATTQRRVIFVSITNESASVSNTVTLQLDVSTTDYRLMQPITLAPNESVKIEEDGHFTIYDDLGIPLANGGGGGGGGLSAVVDDTSPVLGGNINFNRHDVSNPYAFGTSIFFCSTQSECQAALDRCASGLGTTTPTGCDVWHTGGTLDVSTTSLAVAGDGNSSTGNAGLRFHGVGGGGSGGNYDDGGSVIKVNGALAAITVGSCSNCEISGFEIDGDHDNDVGTANDATVGIDVLPTSGSPTKLAIDNVTVHSINGTGIRYPAATGGFPTPQADQTSITNTFVYNSTKCYEQRHSQSVEVVLGPHFSCTTNNGTGPFIDIQAGSLAMSDSYVGLVTNNSVGIAVAAAANSVFVNRSRFEMNAGVTGVTYIDDNDGSGATSTEVHSYRDLDFVFDGNTHTAIDYRRRGNLELRNLQALQSGSGSTPYTIAINVARDTNYGGNQTMVELENLHTRQYGASPTTFPERWLPTINSDVVVKSNVLANDTLPTPCAWWEVGRDTNATSGQQLYGCESGTWTLQSSSSSSGDSVRAETGTNSGSYTTLTDVDLDDAGDIDFAPDTAPTPDQVTAEIKTDAVGANEIAAGGVGTSEVADGTLTGDDVAAPIAGDGLTKDTSATPDEIDVSPGTGLRVSGDQVMLDETASLSGDHALSANEEKFGANGLIFEGSSADASESYVTITNPTADRTFTIPDASSNPVQPTTCAGSAKVSGISSAGVITCSSDLTVVSTLISGTSALGTSAIGSGSCATVVTTSATGAATTDAIEWSPNADISGVTGYSPSTSGGLIIYDYPTANNVNFKVCNPTTASITPGAVTLNWRIVK